MPKLAILIYFMLLFSTRSTTPSVIHPRPALKALARQGNAVMRSGNLPQAEAIFHAGLAQARQKADWVYVSGFFTSLGVIRVNQARYRQALDYFVQAQEAAHQAGSPQEEGFASFNIGVIYARLGDWNRGRTAILEASRIMAPDKQPGLLNLNLANYESRLRNFAAADRYFRRAIDDADLRPETDSVAATSWEQWGLSYLDRDQPGPAEYCLLESYRRHRLAKRPDAEQIHYGFARLALVRGDLHEARKRAAQYVLAARSKPLYYPLWEAYRVAAEIEEQAGDLPKAHDLYLRGVDWARTARAERLPSVQLMATAESALQSLYLGLIRVAYRWNQQRPQPSLILGALEAAEEGRSAALTENHPLLTDDYWQALDQLQRTQAKRLAQDSALLASEGEALRARLINFESEAGLRTPSPVQPQEWIAQARQALAPNEAILVFRTGQPHSYAWRLTRDQVAIRVLPDEKSINVLVQGFRKDALTGQALPSVAGKKLFSQIIGEFSLPESTYIRWTVVPDGPLHELPFAALPWPNREGKESYLVEHATLMLAPSVATLAFKPPPVANGPAFAGIADPIYNSADPRLAPLPQKADVLALFRSAPVTFEMARLPGSQAEVEAALRELRPPQPIILSGDQVNRRAFLALLERRCNTLHLATHVVSLPGDSRHALIALGMNPKTRDQELVGAEEINARRQSANLVIMSGCGSGRGEALPGAGLMSLTRAWILSGASGVVASHWPVADSSGQLFERFYRHARPSGPRPSEAHRWASALQQAQLESIRQRIPASVWAAYFLTGRN
ncbi:MAG: CHAT domain-containing protein [Bryobacteraceae bacterium]|nr:CHAT domain-containing protein [Bryobacteraceae bacterium]